MTGSATKSRSSLVERMPALEVHEVRRRPRKEVADVFDDDAEQVLAGGF